MVVRSLGVFCFKQKTAYEMRISDWSSDVCSSDLYFGGSTVTVTLSPDDGHGCDVHLVETGIASAEEWVENHAGWVSVLLALKATGDFGVDLRAHDPARSWEGRHVDC